MRVPSSVDSVLEAAGDVGTHGLGVRGLIAVATAGCWATAAGVGEVSTPATVVLVVVTIASIARPDSGAPLATIATLVGMWMLEVRPVAVGWSIVLGLGVLVVHVAAARASAMGNGARLRGDVARRWLVQTVVVAAVTTTVWAFVVLLSQASLRGGLAVTSIALVAVAAFAVAADWVNDPDRAR
jgi:hypothetical protein